MSAVCEKLLSSFDFPWLGSHICIDNSVSQSGFFFLFFSRHHGSMIKSTFSILANMIFLVMARKPCVLPPLVKGSQFYCLKVILPKLDWLHFRSFLDLTARLALHLPFHLSIASLYVFTTHGLWENAFLIPNICFHCHLAMNGQFYIFNGPQSTLIALSYSMCLPQIYTNTHTALTLRRHFKMLSGWCKTKTPPEINHTHINTHTHTEKTNHTYTF